MEQPQRAGEFSGQIVIVTGGVSGIGAAAARQLAMSGATIILFDLNAPTAPQAAAETSGVTDGTSSSMIVDVTDQARVKDAVATVVEEHGRIDILINSAGWNQFRTPETLDEDNWRKILAVNLDGTWNCCYAVMPMMMRQRSGSIVNVGSSAALLAIPNAIPYSTAKHGLIGLTRSLAIDLGPHGIRVNCVCPGSTLTPLLERSVSDDFRQRMTARTPLRRLGKPNEIAEAICFLASDRASWISGVALPVDGGMVAGSRAEHWT